jgi:hypothetical protein
MAPRIVGFNEKSTLELKELNARRKQPDFLPNWSNSNSNITEETFTTEAPMIPPPPSNISWPSSMPSWNENLSSMRNQSMRYNVPEVPFGYNSNLATKPRSRYDSGYNRMNIPETEGARWQRAFMGGTDSAGSFAHGEQPNLSNQFMNDIYSKPTGYNAGAGNPYSNIWNQSQKRNVPGPMEMSEYGGADKDSLYGELWKGLKLAPDLLAAAGQWKQAGAMEKQVTNTGRAIDDKRDQWNTANLQNKQIYNSEQDRIKRVLFGRRPGASKEEQDKATAHLTYL